MKASSSKGEKWVELCCVACFSILTLSPTIYRREPWGCTQPCLIKPPSRANREVTHGRLRWWVHWAVSRPWWSADQAQWPTDLSFGWVTDTWAPHAGKSGCQVFSLCMASMWALWSSCLRLIGREEFASDCWCGIAHGLVLLLLCGCQMGIFGLWAYLCLA